MALLSLSVNFKGLPDLVECLRVLVFLNFLNVFQKQPSQTPTNFAIATLNIFPCLFKLTICHLKLGDTFLAHLVKNLPDQIWD